MSLTCYAMKEFLSRIQRQVDKALESWRNYIGGGKFAIPGPSVSRPRSPSLNSVYSNMS